MIFLLACTPSRVPDGLVAIDSAWTTPSATAGELTVNVAVRWQGEWPVVGVEVEGQPATLTHAQGSRTATATFSLTRALAAALDAADGVQDGAGSVTIEAWSLKADAAPVELAFEVDPSPASPVDELVVHAELLTDVELDEPYLPADGSVRVAVDIIADRWAVGAAVVPSSTGVTPAPASGVFAADDDAALFAFLTGPSAGSALAGASSSLTVGATAGGRVASAVVPVRGPPSFAAGTTTELVIADTVVVATFAVRTDGVLAACSATIDRASAVTVALGSGEVLLGPGAAEGWVELDEHVQQEVLTVTVPAALAEAATLLLTCRDPYGQSGSLVVAVREDAL